MCAFFSRDHFIIGYDKHNILYIKNGDMLSFDFLHKLGYDPSKEINEKNNLLVNFLDTRVRIFGFSPRNLLLKPSITMVCSVSLKNEEAVHLYKFCELMGGINITLTRVRSVIDFIKRPDFKLIHTNYVVVKNKKDYKIYESRFGV